MSKTGQCLHTKQASLPQENKEQSQLMRDKFNIKIAIINENMAGEITKGF